MGARFLDYEFENGTVVTCYFADPMSMETFMSERMYSIVGDRQIAFFGKGMDHWVSPNEDFAEKINLLRDANHGHGGDFMARRNLTTGKIEICNSFPDPTEDEDYRASPKFLSRQAIEALNKDGWIHPREGLQSEKDMLESLGLVMNYNTIEGARCVSVSDGDVPESMRSAATWDFASWNEGNVYNFTIEDRDGVSLGSINDVFLPSDVTYNDEAAAKYVLELVGA